jgi:PAS domain S-box-containing protein
MMPNTALALFLIGLAGALRAPQNPGRAAKVASALAALVTLSIGVGTLTEYALGIDLRIDRALIRSDFGPQPGRPSPVTAVALTLLGSGLLVFDVRPAARVRPAEGLVLLSAIAAFTALVGHAFGAGPFYRFVRAPVIGVALPTALALLLVSVGMLLLRPDRGLTRAATAPGPGGVLLRRLVLPALVAPALLGVAVTRGAAALDASEPSIAVAVLAATSAIVSLILVTLAASPLNRAQTALEESRARTRELVEQAPDGVFVADLEGRYMDVNGVGCRMLGYARDEIVGKTIVDLIAPDETERLGQSKEELLGGRVHVGEWHLRHKDGTYLPVEVSATILADGRWQAFVRDVSERRRAQDELRQTQERVELALAGADLGAWDWNIQSGEVVFNARWAEMRGYRLDEVRGHVDSWMEGIHPEDLPAVKTRLDQYLRGAVPEYEAEMRVRTKSGHWMWILDRGKVFGRDRQGRPTRMVGTELDVTARKNADVALRLAEAKSSGILSISADAIISIDPEQRITMFNEGAERVFGYTKEEALGAPLDILIPERWRAAHRQHVSRFAAGDGAAARAMGERGAAIFGLRKDGREFPADAAISRLAVAGTTILTVTLRDISAQKRVEWEQRFLAGIGPALASSLDYEQTLANLAQVTVGELADFCIVDAVDDSGQLRRIEVACREPGAQWIADLLMRSPPDWRPSELFSAAFENKQAVLIAESDARPPVDLGPRRGRAARAAGRGAELGDSRAAGRSGQAAGDGEAALVDPLTRVRAARSEARGRSRASGRPVPR